MNFLDHTCDLWLGIKPRHTDGSDLSPWALHLFTSIVSNFGISYLPLFIFFLAATDRDQKLLDWYHTMDKKKNCKVSKIFFLESLILVLRKIMEAYFKEKIVELFENKSYFSNSQLGFRKGKSVDHVLLEHNT